MLENLEIQKLDVYEGVVVNTNRQGAIIRLLGTEIDAFCFCSAKLGDRVLVSISKVENNRIRCRIDSFRYDAARTRANARCFLPSAWGL